MPPLIPDFCRLSEHSGRHVPRFHLLSVMVRSREEGRKEPQQHIPKKNGDIISVGFTALPEASGLVLP